MKNVRLLVPLLMPLFCSASLAAGAAPLPVIQAAGINGATSPFADIDVNVGGQILKWKDAPIHDFGPREVTFDATGMRSLRPAPPPRDAPAHLLYERRFARVAPEIQGNRIGSFVLENHSCVDGNHEGTLQPKGGLRYAGFLE